MNFKPESRIEEVLYSIKQGIAYLSNPESRIEYSLLKKFGKSNGKVIEGAPPLTFMSNGLPLADWTIYGAEDGVGDKITPPYGSYSYKIPITCGGETTNIYLDKPLGEGESISMADTGVEISTINGENTLTVDTTIQPSKVSVKVAEDIAPIVYGWHVDPNISSPSDAVMYLKDAVGMTPAAMGTTEFDYGSWGDAFFMPKPCMLRYDCTVAYYLDPSDYSKKLDGTPSDISNPDFEGNAMMEWGKIWFKFEGGSEDGEGYFYVANKKIDESYHCWCNINSQNEETDHFYTAIYNSTLHNGRFRSLSGYVLTQDNGCGNTTATEEITYATANNTSDNVEWYIGVYADLILINALLVLVGKSLNTQALYGRGLDTGDEATKSSYVTGSLNDKRLFYGVTANGDSGVKVFGMENWWGCVFRRTAGCISVDRECKVKLTYGTADGSEAQGYNTTGNGYISVGNIPSSNGYVKKFKYSEYGIIPYEAGGSSLTYYSDYFYQNTGTRYLYYGGRAGVGVYAGAFCFALNGTASTRGWLVSASLSCKPIKEA